FWQGEHVRPSGGRPVCHAVSGLFPTLGLGWTQVIPERHILVHNLVGIALCLSRWASAARNERGRHTHLAAASTCLSANDLNPHQRMQIRRTHGSVKKTKRTLLLNFARCLEKGSHRG